MAGGEKEESERRRSRCGRTCGGGVSGVADEGTDAKRGVGARSSDVAVIESSAADADRERGCVCHWRYNETGHLSDCGPAGAEGRDGFADRGAAGSAAAGRRSRDDLLRREEGGLFPREP